MEAWKPVLVATIGGLTLGLVGGKAADPRMVQRGEDVLGKATEMRISAPYQRTYEGGPQDLSPHTGRYSYAPYSDGVGFSHDRDLDDQLTQERLRAQIDAELMASNAYWEAQSYSPTAMLDATQPEPPYQASLATLESANRVQNTAEDAALAAADVEQLQDMNVAHAGSEPPAELRRAQGELPAVY